MRSTSQYDTLEDAIRSSDLDGVKQHVEAGVDVNIKDVHNWTALEHVLHSAEHFPEHKLQIAEYLITKGANVNARDALGKSLLHQVLDVDFRANKYSFVKLLVDHKADVNAKDKEFGNTPLHEAIFFHDLESTKYLVEHGADVNAKNKRGATPLHDAIDNAEHLDIVRYLITRGADVNAKDKSGDTPLHMCARRKGITYIMDRAHAEAVKYLVEHDADLQATNREGHKPLHAAAQGGNADTIKYLIERDVAQSTFAGKETRRRTVPSAKKHDK